MEKLCSKIILVKSGSKIVSGTDEVYELLEDLEVDVSCNKYYTVEKQGIFPDDTNIT